MTVKFQNTSFGPGSFVRFKELKSHRWEYAIYRGTEDRAYQFSDTPLGPITRWMHVWPTIIECAVARISDYRPALPGTDKENHQ